METTFFGPLHVCAFAPVLAGNGGVEHDQPGARGPASQVVFVHKRQIGGRQADAMRRSPAPWIRFCSADSCGRADSSCQMASARS